MTDLAGAELAFATARVMGRPCALGELITGYPNTVTCFSVPTTDTALLPLSLYEWRPDQGGAAAWEVLEWVRGQVNVVAVTIESYGNGGSVCMVAPAMSFHGTTIGHGSTDAIALCRAVVALGEEG